MSDHEITIQVSDEIISNLKKVFVTPSDDGSDSFQVEEILAAALDQWHSTIFGGHRYRSLTELYLEWLKGLFAVLALDESIEPTEQVLYSDFNFPFGQAAYLARVLREDQPRTLRLRFISELIQALEARKDEALQWIKNGRGEDDRLTLHISKSARRQLEHLLGSLARVGQPVHPLRTEGTLGDFVAVQIIAQDIPLLLDQLNDLQKELSKST